MSNGIIFNSKTCNIIVYCNVHDCLIFNENDCSVKDYYYVYYEKWQPCHVSITKRTSNPSIYYSDLDVTSITYKRKPQSKYYLILCHNLYKRATKVRRKYTFFHLLKICY